MFQNSGGPKFSQFHAVFLKIWQNHCWRPPPPGDWRPLLRGILDPTLQKMFTKYYYDKIQKMLRLPEVLPV